MPYIRFDRRHHRHGSAFHDKVDPLMKGCAIAVNCVDMQHPFTFAQGQRRYEDAQLARKGRVLIFVRFSRATDQHLQFLYFGRKTRWVREGKTQLLDL